MAHWGAGDESRLLATVLQAFEEAGADFEPVLDLACSLGAALTGDVWVIRLVDEEGHLRLAGSAGPDPTITADLRRTLGPLRSTFSVSLASAVWQEGVPVRVTPELIAATQDVTEPELIELHVRCGFQGALLAPLRVRGRVIGILWWACLAHDGEHDDDDLRFAASVADRCALAIDNARLLRHIEAERNRHASLLAQVTDAICIVDAEGIVQHVTPGGITRVLGWQPDELVGSNIFDLVHRRDQEHAISGFLRAIGPDDWKPFVLRVRHKLGQWKHLRVSAQNLLDDPAVRGVVITGRDVTEEVFAEELLAQENDILERVAMGAPLNDTLDAICQMIDSNIRRGVATLWLVDDDSGVLVPTAGPNAGPLPTIDEDLSRQGVDFTNSLEADEISVSDVRYNPEWEPWREEAIATGVAGSWNRPIRDAEGSTYGIVIIYRTDLREPDEQERAAIQLASRLAAVAVHRARDAVQLAHAATHDTVTGLPNRRLFLQRLEEAVARQARGAQPPSVLFVDLDRFKQVNDRAGHAAGDEVLRILGGRLQRAVRPADVVARFGGDELAVLCDETDAEEAVSIAERLLSTICEPVELEGRRHHLSASIGIATGRIGTSHDALVRHADLAMYRAKQQGAGGIVAFRTGMGEGGTAGLEQDLRKAIDECAITVHYQPIVMLSTHRWIGIEALARWDHPVRGAVSPSTFVPLAEEIGLAVPLGECVLSQVARDAQLHFDGPAAELLVGVNVSSRQLADPRFLGTITQHVLGAGIDPQRIYVELTETAMMEEYEAARTSIAALAELGVQLAIDDFGAGHSTLSRLRQVPAGGLKLDRTFIAEIGDLRTADIIAAVVQLAHALGMLVCAEGVETREQLTAVRRLGVDLAQGYLLARPMSAEQVRRLVAGPVPV